MLDNHAIEVSYDNTVIFENDVLCKPNPGFSFEQPSVPTIIFGFQRHSVVINSPAQKKRKY